MRQTNKNGSGDNKENYVPEKITNTLLELLRNKSLKDISISELCDSAGVGRASFYRNFESKEDILRKYDNRLIKLWGKEFESNKNSSVESIIPTLLIHYKKA